MYHQLTKMEVLENLTHWAKNKYDIIFMYEIYMLDVIS